MSDSYVGKSRNFLIEEIERLEARVKELEFYAGQSKGDHRSQNNKDDEDKHFQASLLNAVEQCVIATRPDGEIIYWNPFSEKTYGWKSSEVISKNLMNLMSPEVSKELEAEIKTTLLAGKSWSGELDVRRKDGSVFTAYVSDTPLCNHKGEITSVIRVATDISEKKRTEAERKDNETKYKALFENAPLSYQSLCEDGTFLDVNPTWLNTLGYKRDEVIGARYSDFLHPDWKEHFEANFPKFKKRGYINDVQFKIRHKEGHFLDISFNGCIGYNPDGSVKQTYCVFQYITERKEAEFKMRESESNIAALINNTDDSIWSLDRDYRYIIYNNAYARIFYNEYGTPVQKGLDSRQFLKPEEYDFWVSKCESVFEGSKVTFEFSHELDNDLRSFQTSMNPIYEGEKVTGLSAMSVDITDVKRAERIIAESNERYKTLFNDSPIPLWEEDFTELVLHLDELKKAGNTDLGAYFETHPEELGKCAQKIKILEVNRAALKLHKASSKEELLQGLENTFTPRSYEVFKEEVMAIAEGKSEYRTEGEVKTLTGELRHVYLKMKIDRSNPDIYKAFISTSDITDRKLALDKIKESEMKFRTIFNESTDGIMLLDTHSNPIDANNKICEILGYSKDELMAINATEHIHPEDVKDIAYEDALEKLLSGQSIYSTYRLRKKNGELIFIDIGVKMLETGLFLNIIRDISDRIKLEKEAQKAQEEVKKLNEELERKVIERTAQLERANKELETFSYSVSHDLKAPLRGIDGYSKLLQDAYYRQLDEEGKLFLTNIRSSTNRMNQLIDDLLEYSRVERREIIAEAISIKSFLTSLVETYSDELHVGKFDFRMEMDDSVIMASSKALSIVLRNIIENAIKFSKERKKPVITMAMESTATTWIISIQDNGIGFDMKYKQKIFDIFQRLHRPEDYPGTGIGLALVKKAMQRMNGKAWAESYPDKGSTFYLELPKPNGYAKR